MLRWNTCGLALAAAALVLGGCASSGSAPMTTEQREQHMASFDQVWVTVRDRHWDKDMNGVDWEAAREQYRPRVESAEDAGDVRRAIANMLGELDASHYGLIPASTYEAMDRGETPGGDGDAGLAVRLVDGEMLVWKTRPDGPADAAGVRTGWALRSIRGENVAPLIGALSEMDGVSRGETMLPLVIASRLGGPIGGSLDLVFEDGDGNEQAVTLVLDESPGERVGLGNLPPVPVEIETETLSGGIGYFRLSIFLDPPRVMPAFSGFVREHRGAPGIVIDLRGNPGGIILMASGMGGHLVEEKDIYLGKLIMRESELRLVLNPRGKPYAGKVAVLIDEVSISNSEILSAGLKDVGRARLFGRRTAGQVLPSTVERLPNGDGFQYAFANYTSASGESLERSGVEPDVEIELDRDTLLEGRDATLEAALDWILEDRRASGG
ncbi:MAG: S41 family peptidase [Planctomycetota bacterium]